MAPQAGLEPATGWLTATQRGFTGLTFPAITTSHELVVKMGKHMNDSELLEALQRLLITRASTTFTKLAEDYLEIYASKHKRSWHKDMSYIDKYLVPSFGSRDISTINVAEVQKLHSSISNKYPVAANRTIEVLSKMFNLALQWGYFHGKNPCQHIVHNREESRERYLSDDEARRVFYEIDSLGPAIRALIYLYIITGRRKDELRSLTWDKINFKDGFVEFWDSKRLKKVFHPMSEMSRKLLSELPRIGKYVFVHDRVSAQGSRHFGSPVGIDRFWRIVRSRAGVDDVTIHDFRRTCATWLVESGESIDIAKQVLNHSSTKTTKIYAIATSRSVGRVYERIGENIEKLRG